MRQQKSLAEFERIRVESSELVEQQNKERRPEKNKVTPKFRFEIARYTTGQLKGLYLIYEIGHDGKRKQLIVEGVFMLEALKRLAEWLRRQENR